MAFEIHGLILALHYEARFLKTPGSEGRAHTGFAHIVARYGSEVATGIARIPATPKSAKSGKSAKVSKE